MNLTIEEGLDLVKQVLDGSSSDGSEIIFFPPSIALSAIGGVLKNTDYKVGIQNIHHEKSGAYTGEISAEMVKFLDVQYAIIGHSERRQYFFETDAQINGKIKSALSANLCPVVCVGESLPERQSGKTNEILKKQLMSALKDIDNISDRLVIAYEPVWAIGTGKSADLNQVYDAHNFINEILQSRFKNHTPILYGGSVKAENASELCEIKNVDGFLIGGASLQSESFCQIIKNVT
tara:strand:- start:414 stop:1118 length:705 start_codon:yes stop_codon:yes gene_type:complete